MKYKQQEIKPTNSTVTNSQNLIEKLQPTLYWIGTTKQNKLQSVQ